MNLARAGHIDAGDLSDFEQDIMEGLPEEAGWMTGEEEGPVDPNQMAAMRPGFFTEAALLAVGG